MPTFTNIRGTSEQHFRISLSGPTIYHGTADPTGTPPAPLGGGLLNAGDLYIRTGPTAQGLYVLGTTGGTDWNEFLETGATAPTIIAGDLTVQGEFDTYDPLIVLNSNSGSLATGSIGGIQLDRPLGESVQWIWDDLASHWKPSNTGVSDPSLHNVYIGNDLTVVGLLTAPDGLSTSPGIRFSSAGVGVYSTGTDLGFSTGGSSKWIITGAGHLVPSVGLNVGVSGTPVNAVYSLSFFGSDGVVGAPTYSFDSDTTTGMYLPAVSTLGITVGGGLTTSFTTTEVDLLVPLQLSDGLDSWQMDHETVTNNLTFSYNATTMLDITNTGEILAVDGSVTSPSYSFDSKPAAGMYYDSGDDAIKFTYDGILDNMILRNDGIVRAGVAGYTALITDGNDLTNKDYVDSLGASSWRKPVIVKDDSPYVSLGAAEIAMNTGFVNGEPVVEGDRILYTSIVGSQPNVYIIVDPIGTPATLLEEVTDIAFGSGALVGDTVYVNEGADAGTVFSFDINGFWTEISGSGGGGTMYFNYEDQTVSGAPQSVFILTTAKYAVTPDGSRLLVYVNGVKQVYGLAYAENNEATVTFVAPVAIGQVVEFYAVGLTTSDGILNREVQIASLTPGPGVPGIGAPLITFIALTYAVAQAGLLVYLNGQKMLVDGPSPNYSEVAGGNQIQWIAPALVAGDVLEFYSSVPIIANTDLEAISNVSGNIPLDGDQFVYDAGFSVWKPQAPGSTAAGVLYDDETTFPEGLPNGAIFTFTMLSVKVLTKTIPPLARSYQQVFVNGVLQKEGLGKDYQVSSGAQTVTFTIAPALGDSIDVYQL